jgi:hypothetical protein
MVQKVVVGQPYSITSSAAGIIFTFGSVMDIRLGATFALFIRHLVALQMRSENASSASASHRPWELWDR